MKLMTCLSSLISAMALTAISAHAAEIYKMVPFKLTMSKDDVVNVNYDYSEKKAILCTADDKKIRIDFTYKGRKKFASLPIILQSDHVPNKKNEALADLNGRFTLSLNTAQEKKYAISCRYPGLDA